MVTNSAMEGLGDAQRMVEHALNDENQYKQIIETKGDDAQRWLDMLQVGDCEISDRRTTYYHIEATFFNSQDDFAPVEAFRALSDLFRD
ncbi:hypothetical protein AAF712_009036 [Marasmius tenuissimus]|uniref:Uncharacterized protein n=1 Tax=Marasmius tenuissimus TaxID=585030 RepID=A0ABR2ZS20_9AGAR